MVCWGCGSTKGSVTTSSTAAGNVVVVGFVFTYTSTSPHAAVAMLRITRSSTATIDGKKGSDPFFHAARASAIFVNVSFASPKTSTVFSFVKSSFSMPAKPGFIERLSTMHVRARSALSTGMP